MEYNDCQVTPISDIRLTYELSGSDLKEKLTELEIDLLIYRPANVDIYASASVITLNSNEPKTLKDYHKKHKGNFSYLMVQLMLAMKAIGALGIGYVLGRKDLITTYRKALSTL